MSGHVKTVFVSGANRGIGLGFTLKLAERGWQVVAGYRSKERSHALFQKAQQSQNIFPAKVDVMFQNALADLHDFIAEQFGHLDMIINNAGISIQNETAMNELQWTHIADSIMVNVGGPFMTSKHLYPLIKKGHGKKIINVSSGMGSIEHSSGGWTPYRVSKAALNMLTKNQAADYRHDGITVIALSPGWVKTEMGGREATMTVDESVSAMLKVIDAIDIANTGRFLSHEGKAMSY